MIEMTIHIQGRPKRKKPALGDRKVIKGVLHERTLKRAYGPGGQIIGYDCTGGRQNYVWTPVETTPPTNTQGEK